MTNGSTIFDKYRIWSEQCERGIVHYFLDHPEMAPDIAASVRPVDFFNESLAVICETAIRCLNEGGCDFENICRTLEREGNLAKAGGVEFIAKLWTEFHAPSHLPNYAARIRRYSNARKSREAMVAAINDLDGGENHVKVASRLESELSEVCEPENNAKPVLLRDAVMETLREEDATGEAIPTGFSGIDNLITGFREGQMIIIGGRPSQGKTSLAVNIMLNMAKVGRKLIFFSLEMAKAEIVHRMIAVVGECDLSKEVMARSKPSWTREKIANAANEIYELPIHIDDTPGRTIFEIESVARNYVKNEGIEAIFVDHLGWVETGEKKQTEYEQVTKVARRLKNLARTLQVPVVVLSQLNRAVENRKEIRPRMSDLRSSGAIEQDADVVMFIHREEYYRKKEDAEADDSIRGKADIIVAKVRNGATGDVRMNWEGCTTRFYEDQDVEPWDANGESGF